MILAYRERVTARGSRNQITMIKSAQLRESTSLRISLSLLLALIINVLLLFLIHTLVSTTRGAIDAVEEAHIVEFMRLEPQLKDRETPQDKPEQKRGRKREPLPQPLQALTPSYERQQLPLLKPPRLDLDLRATLSGGPYLGNFEPVPTLTDLDADEPSLQIPPLYPPRAKRMGIEGKVTVEFTISTDGSVENAKIVDADPPKVFDQAVLRAIRRWKFSPRLVNKSPIERRARKQIVFKLERQ